MPVRVLVRSLITKTSSKLVSVKYTSPFAGSYVAPTTSAPNWMGIVSMTVLLVPLALLLDRSITTILSTSET